MKLSIRNENGKLPLPWAIAIGFAISFAICLILTFSVPLTGQLIGSGNMAVEAQEQQVAMLLSALTSLWWWSLVSILGVVITTYVARIITLS